MRTSGTLLATVVAASALTLADFPALAQTPPQTLRVDRQAEGMEDGSSREDAFTTLAACLEYISGFPPPAEGWQIWVAQGEYIPSPEEQTFNIRDLTFAYGGFLGSETTRQQRDPEAYETILSGEAAPDRRLRKRIQPAPGQTMARVDIGAHEYPNCICSTGDFNEDNSVNGSDLGVLLGSWGTSANRGPRTASPIPPPRSGEIPSRPRSGRTPSYSATLHPPGSYTSTASAIANVSGPRSNS